jgi:hypothetical protein
MPVQGHWDLAVAFGLLHHIPAARLRQLFVDRMAELVRPGGLLVLTFWDYLPLPRFQRRLASWKDYNRTTSQPLDLAQLEPGDTLLRWGKGGSEVRYCHQVSDEEIDVLLALLPCTPIDRFRADGHLGTLNRYLILERI